MEEFATASEMLKTYKIEGQKGSWVQVKYREAMKNPASIRALKKATVCWFVPFVVAPSIDFESIEQIDEYVSSEEV